jgi:hypothetical protein
MELTIRPLTPDLWPALEDLFGAMTIVFSTSVLRMLGVCPETLQQLESRAVVAEVLPTPEAVETYNRLVGSQAAVGALIHATC